MITDPLNLFALLAAMLGVIFWCSRRPFLAPVFHYLPPIVWIFFLPMILSSFGVIPRSSPVYDILSVYALPAGLFLMTLSVDLPALARIGRLSGIMMTVSVVSILIGVIVSYALLRALLPVEAWQGLTALSASWIGGTANMIAWQQGLDAPASTMSSVLVVDTVIAYGWLAAVVALSAFQKTFDRWARADGALLKRVDEAAKLEVQEKTPVSTPDLAIMTGLAFGLSFLAIQAASYFPTLGDPPVLTAKIWTMMLIVFVAMALSLTPVRRLDRNGASQVGLFILLFLMAAIGAKADVSALLQAPVYMLAGFIIIGIHIGLLIVTARVVKAPLAIAATASIASVNGAISAPIAAAAYNRGLASLGVILGIAGYIAGIYAPAIAAFTLSRMIPQ